LNAAWLYVSKSVLEILAPLITFTAQLTQRYMKLFYGTVFLLAMIVVFTAGVKRSNHYFNDRNVGEAKFLTPATTMTNSPSDSTNPEEATEIADSAAAGGHTEAAGHEGAAAGHSGH
jgi:hypothetical protein